LQLALDGLRENYEAQFTPLIIYSDAPRCKKDEDLVNEVRSILDDLEGFYSIKVVKRKTNLGLSQSIISGVNEVLEEHESIIVLEDDIIPSPFFLKYMNEALNKYSVIDRVGCIHAYSYPCSNPLPDTFFLRGADCWGWGTWKNAWNLFEENGQTLLDKILKSQLSYEFDQDGTFPYTQMLRDHINGLIDSWAIRWHASLFLLDKLCLYPGLSLVQNIGCDSSGTHSLKTNNFHVNLSETPNNLPDIPIEECVSAKNAFQAFFRQAILKN